MRSWKRWSLAVVVGASLALGSAAGVWADHQGGGRGGTDVRGVVTAFTLTPPSTPVSGSGGGGTGSGTTGSSLPTSAGVHFASRHRDGLGAVLSGTPVGTLTVLSPVEGTVEFTVLSTTRFEVTGAALAENLVGASVNVTAVPAPGATSGAAGGASTGSGAGSTLALDAVQVQTENGDLGESQQIRGTVTAIDTTTTPGTISIQTEGGATVTAQLDPNVTVTLGDNVPGTLSDVTVGARVKASWQVIGGQMDITAIRILGGGGPNGQGETQAIEGTVTAIDTTTTPGTISIQTEGGATLTAQLDPNVTVTLGDNVPGTLSDVTVGARVKAFAQTSAGGQLDITAIRILGGASARGGG